MLFKTGMKEHHGGCFITHMRSALNGKKFLVREPAPFLELTLSYIGDFPDVIDVNEVGRRANYSNMSWEGLSGKFKNLSFMNFSIRTSLWCSKPETLIRCHMSKVRWLESAN